MAGRIYLSVRYNPRTGCASFYRRGECLPAFAPVSLARARAFLNQVGAVREAQPKPETANKPGDQAGRYDFWQLLV